MSSKAAVGPAVDQRRPAPAGQDERMMNMKDASTPQEVQMVRLTQAVYKTLEDKMGKVYVGDNTTDLQAGYMLGVQAVLKVLREGYVING